MENRFKKEWKAIEHEDTQPRWFSGNVIEYSYDEFQKDVMLQNSRRVKSIIESLYIGDVFVLKNSFPKDYMLRLKKTMHEYGKKSESAFHKMLDGCPDFHRQITPELAKNYGLRQIKHSYYFFPWNKDVFNLFSFIYKRWGVFKFLSGFQFNEYEKNTPSTGVVDRLQIAKYPSGVGELEVHRDPYLYQKVALAGIMSKKGGDFETGGAYAVAEGGKRYDLEDTFDIGDIYVLYPTVLHGIETIDKGGKVDWDSMKGRWFMGLYSNASDQYANRHTVYGVEDNLGKNEFALKV
jgi:hypothetical protein